MAPYPPQLIKAVESCHILSLSQLSSLEEEVLEFFVLKKFVLLTKGSLSLHLLELLVGDTLDALVVLFLESVVVR